MSSDVPGRDFRLLTADDVRQLAPDEALLRSLMEDAFRAASSGIGAQSPRHILGRPSGGVISAMLGDRGASHALGAKLTTVQAGNAALGLPTHFAEILLFEGQTGRPTALIDGASVTMLRTAAATAAATDRLARLDSRRLAILGSGHQAQAHLKALRAVRPFTEIRIWSRTAANAERMCREAPAIAGQSLTVAASPAEATAGADVICTLTSAREPILDAAHLADGAHVNLVGSSFAHSREVTDALVAKTRFFVDKRENALAEGGELRSAISAGLVSEQHILAEVGEVLNGLHPGRQSSGDITVFKSLGMPLQDIVLAEWLADAAHARQVGAVLPREAAPAG